MLTSRMAREWQSGAEGSRTLDLLNAIQALSQLSYGPTGGKNPSGAGHIARGRERVNNFRARRLVAVVPVRPPDVMVRAPLRSRADVRQPRRDPSLARIPELLGENDLRAGLWAQLTAQWTPASGTMRTHREVGVKAPPRETAPVRLLASVSRLGRRAWGPSRSLGSCSPFLNARQLLPRWPIIWAGDRGRRPPGRSPPRAGTRSLRSVEDADHAAWELKSPSADHGRGLTAAVGWIWLRP